MKKFKADWQIAAFFWVIGLLMVVVFYFDPPQVGWFKSTLVLIFFYIFPISLLISEFTYVIIGDKQLKYVLWLFVQRRVNIDMIYEISMREKFGKSSIGWRFPQLFIYYDRKGGRKGKLVVPIGIWRKDTVADLCSMLINTNPKIKFDKRVAKLARLT